MVEATIKLNIDQKIKTQAFSPDDYRFLLDKYTEQVNFKQIYNYLRKTIWLLFIKKKFKRQMT